MDGQADLLSRAGVGEVAGAVASTALGRRGGRDRRQGGVSRAVAARAALPDPELLDHVSGGAGADPARLEAPEAATGGDGARTDAAPVQAAPAPALDGYGEPRPPFGQWLLRQKNRDGLIGLLVDGANRDPAFPKRGTPEDVRKRLRAVQADGDLFQAVDDAEMDWLSY